LQQGISRVDFSIQITLIFAPAFYFAIKRTS
jgi:hypothetical protein